MTTYTDTIGVGGGFVSLSLWHGTSASVPVSGDVMDVEFLSGTHDIGGTYNSFTATDLTINLKAHASALHNGEWDGPVQITWSTRPDWYFDDQTINLNLNDLVIKMTSDNFLLWNHVGTSGNSANYESNVTFNRCLISNWSQDYAYIAVSYLSLFDGPASNPTAYGTFKWEMNNCVVEQQNAARFLLYNSDTGVTNPYYAQKRYFNGCTFKNVNFGDRTTDNGPLDIQVSGCLNDSGSIRLVPFTASNYTATVTDYITGETTSNAQFNFWATGTNTNVSTAASFNYDGTVTSGEVCFVGPAGPEGNYRLVADLDNLPVKYMTNGELSYKDITGYKRPGGTDQRDAGAFQSISDKDTVYKIGTSSVDFPADYATATLWWSTNYNYANVLNGETHTLQFKSGQVHNPAAGINFNGTDGSVSANVNQSFVYSGQTPHNGNWDEGATLVIDGSTGGATLRCGKNSFNFTVKDLSLVVSGNAINRRVINTLPTHNFNYNTQGYFAPEHTYTFENFMARMDDGLSSIPYTMVMDQNYERITDEDLNILEKGSSKSIHKNCLYIGATSSNGVGDRGSLCVYQHQYDTAASAFFQTEGCTFINSWFSNGRHFMVFDNLKVDHAGLLYYASESHKNQFGFQLGLHSPGNFGAYNNQKPENATFKDCIFNNGSNNSITPNSSQGRNDTWVIEPIDSELDIYSSTVLSEEPWLEWEPRLTNCSFRVPFNFDGSVSAGTVSFESSATKDYRLVADPDNLAVRYMDLSSIWEDCSKDITGRKRPGSTDAGAFQSVSNRIISGNIPAEYATPQLLYTTQDTSSFLNGDTYLAVIESGSSTNGTYLYSHTGGREVDLTIHMKGASPHEGNWDQGTIIVPPTPTAYIANTRLNSARQDIKLVFEDIVFSGNHTNHNSQGPITAYKYAGNAAGATDWWTSESSIGTAPELAVKSRNAYNLEFEFNNCMIQMGNLGRLCMPQVKAVGAEADGTLTQGIVKGSFNNILLLGSVTVGEIYAIAPLYGIADQQFDLEVIGSTFRNVRHLGSAQTYGSVKVIGSLIETGPGGASGVDDGYVESFLRVGWHYNNRNLTFSATDSIFSQASADLIEIENGQVAGSGMLINSIASGFVTNTQFGVPFTFDGTVTNGEVGFQAGGNALSTPRSYYPVVDPDNLAVQYTDSLIGSRDIAGEPRPAEGDVGAFQSISTNVSSFSIGTSAEFNTFTLMHNTIKNDILNGDTIEAEFLSGTHSIAGDIEPKEVNHSYVLKAHASAYHNGDWNSGVNFSGGSIIPTPQDHSFSLTLKDIVVRNHEAGVLMRTYGTTNKSGAYKYSTILDSCLIETGNRFVFNSAWTGGQTLDDSGNVVEVHDRLLEFKNCAIHGLPSCQYVSVWGSVSPQGCAHIEANCIGTTFAKLDLTGAAMIGFFDLAYGGNAEDGSLTYNISGSLIGGQFTHFTDIFQGNGLNAPKVFNFADSVFDDFPLNIPGLVINKTINETNVTNFSQNNNLTNVPFNFDGTVTSGQVNFVDNGGATSLPDLRLVADLDNLPVKYMTQDSLTYKDITGYKRPGGIDQRDAGAYQSISDKNTVYKIGTSSVDFPADYASLNLWWSTNHFYANILNGETHTFQFKSGEIHNPNASINFDGTIGSVSANVNQSFVYSGQTPHNGNWDEGAILAINGSTYGAGLRSGKNSFNLTVKDLSLVVSGNAVNRRLFYVTPTHNRNYTIPGYFAPEHTYTFENFMARMDDGLSSIGYELMIDQNYERITDEDLNVIERGSSKTIHKNCLYVGAASSDGTGFNGSFNVYAHQYDTQASAFFQTEGCTFINSWFSNNRHWIILNQLKVDHAGLLYYAGGRQLALHGPFSFAQGQDLSQNITATNNSKFVDCIFSNGAGDSISFPNARDRYTTWVIEPLPSEYTDPTSADVESVQPWNVWASALTNCSFRVPFNFDGSVSSGTVSFVDGSSGVNNYRLVGSEDNFASGYVSSFNLSGLDLAGNDRGDSPYDAGAFAITLQQVEDFLKSLGGPLVLQVGYRISNNRQRLIPVIGGEE